MRDKTKKKLILDNLLEQFPNTRKFLDKAEADERSNKNRQQTKSFKNIRNNKLKAQTEQKNYKLNFIKIKKKNN